MAGRVRWYERPSKVLIRFGPVRAEISNIVEAIGKSIDLLKQRMDWETASHRLEEANAMVANLDLYTIFSLPHISQIYLFYRAEMTSGEFSPGFESLEVGLFNEAEIPWEELAFQVIRETLEHFFKDRPSGVFPVRSKDIVIDRDPTSFR